MDHGLLKGESAQNGDLLHEHLEPFEWPAPSAKNRETLNGTMRVTKCKEMGG